MAENEIVVQNNSLTSSLVAPGDIVRAIKHVQTVMAGAMTPAVIKDGRMIKDGDYGLIPGCGDKPALRKSGAEILLIAFGLVAHMRPPIFKMLSGDHREVIIETEIRNGNSGALHAVGVGSASTMESKYRWRNSERLCPACGQPAIIKGKAEYGGGWLCFAKRGGCNAKFKDGDQAIEGQQVGREENPDIADMWNTVLKMAAKRSAVDGAIKATASSGMFTQDIDDIPPDQSGYVHDSQPTKKNIDPQEAKKSPTADHTKFKCQKTGKFAPAYCSVCPHKDTCDKTNPALSGGDNDYTSYIAEIDKLESANAVLDWQVKNGDTAKKNLSETDYEKLKSYISQIIDVFNK